jgi:hypothetical protein
MVSLTKKIKKINSGPANTYKFMSGNLMFEVDGYLNNDFINMLWLFTYDKIKKDM